MTPSVTYTVGDVCAAMEAWAPRALAYPNDPVGLDIGDPKQSVNRVLTALSVTQETVRTAQQAGADMIVAHHPLFYRPLTRLRTDDPATRLRLDIASSGLACYSAHTNLDLAPGGVNDVLAERLGLTAVRPLLSVSHGRLVKLVCFVPEAHLEPVRNAVCAAGAGDIGDYSHCTFSSPGIGTFLPGAGSNPFSGEPGRVNEEAEFRFEALVPQERVTAVVDAMRRAHPYEEVAFDLAPLEGTNPDLGLGRRGELPEARPLRLIAEHVCSVLQVSHLRLVGEPDRRVRHVAVLGGSGGGEISAIPDDVDLFITGDVGYHQAQDAMEKGLAVMDAGHGATEKWIAEAMARRLRRVLPEMEIADYLEPEVFQFVAAP